MQHGVNLPTYILINIILGLAVAALLLLLLVSFYSIPVLIPHVFVLLGLAIGLWVSINWFIGNVGLVSAQEQKKELLGEGEGAEVEPGEAAEEQQGKEDSLGAGEIKKQL